MDLVTRTGLTSIAVSGGEPTLYPHLPAYVRALAREGLSVCLLTNGRVLARRDRLEELLDAGVGHFHIPLHAAKAARHDATTRTPGSFDQTVAAMEQVAALRRERLFKFSVVQVVHRDNVARIGEFVAFVSRFYPDYLLFSACIVENESPAHQRDLLAPYAAVTAALEAAAPALAATDLRVHVENIPPCAMRGQETLCLDFHKYNRLDVSGLKATGGGDVPTYEPLGQSIKSDQRAHPAPCQACALKPFCGGIYRSHLATFGDGELAPFSLAELRAMIAAVADRPPKESHHA
jgi:MoaA/NifB/PqqE/SkfB family radical SAM enzyme